jgi:outer membrane protein assembly factor BamB
MNKFSAFAKQVLLGIVFWTSLGMVSPLVAADAPSWPRFRGPKADNRSIETGLLRQWPEGGPRLLWTTEGIGEGFATVAIAAGLIYTDGNIDDKTVITALDLNGKIRWQIPSGKAWTGSQPGTRGTPTIDGGRLYYESPLGEIVCLDANIGKRIWGLNILEEFDAKNITWALAESLLIDGDHVICCPGGPRAAMVALNRRTGQVVWRSPSTGDLAGYASPVLAQHNGLRMILTMTSRAIIGVNAESGDLLWRREHVTPFNENICTPLFHDGWVFTSTGHGVGSVMLKVTVSGQKASVEEVWRSTDLDNHHGGVVLLDGYIYGSCWSPRGWVCLDWRTGRKQYEERGVGKGSLTFADGMLYTLGEQAKVALVKATPAGHQIVSWFRLPAGGTGPVWAHPVVCDGRLYIRHGSFLYAYDIRSRSPVE